MSIRAQQYLSQPCIEEPIWLEPNDMFFLREKLLNSQIQLERIEHQMDELKRVHEAQVSELTRRKDAILVDITSLRNLLSPIRRVPVEILSEIFELSCLPDKGIVTASHDIVRRTTTLSKVCVAWRNASISTPRLWSTLCLSFQHHRKAFTGDVMWIKEWISRSQERLLDFYLDFFGKLKDVSEPMRAGSSQILEYILNVGQRIRLFKLMAHGPSLFFTFFDRIARSSLPFLEVICLQTYRSSAMLLDPLLLPRQIDVRSGAPNLRHVELIDFGVVLSPMALPAEQLISLKIHFTHSSSNSHNYIDLLHRCRNLVCLYIHLPGTLELSPNLSIFLPALNSLEISCNKTTVNLLRYHLTTPVLGDLTLSNWLGFHDMANLATNVADFQRRSIVLLSSLALKDFRIRIQSDIRPEVLASGLLAILGIFPEISSFRIHGTNNIFGINSVVRALTCTTGESVLLPNLTHFELCWDTRYLHDPRRYPLDLTSMVLSRFGQDDASHAHLLSRIQKVTLHGVGFSNDIITLSELPGLEVDHATDWQDDSFIY